jgi:hypothetical protein
MTIEELRALVPGSPLFVAVFDTEDGVPTWHIRPSTFVGIEEPRWRGQPTWAKVVGDQVESMDFGYGYQSEMIHASRADAIRSLRGQLADHRARVLEAIDEAGSKLDEAERAEATS